MVEEEDDGGDSDEDDNSCSDESSWELEELEEEVSHKFLVSIKSPLD